MDPDDRQLDLNNIDANFEYNTKLPNPYKTYLIEENEKLKKQAIDQILENAMTADVKKNPGLSFSNSRSSINFLLTKYKSSNIQKNSIPNKDIIDTYLKNFYENCETHNIHTVDQKIDYFVYLKSNNGRRDSVDKNVKNQNKNHTLYASNKKKINSDLIGNLNNIVSEHISINNTTQNQSPKNAKHSTNDKDNLIFTKYKNIDYLHKLITDLKSKFKLQDENSISSNVELCFNDILLRMGQTKSQAKNLDFLGTLEKIKHFINYKEISNETIILRECEITQDKFYYLVIKKIFDFRYLQHINLSRNSLSDIGGTYLLHLIDNYSTQLDYLNISYNKLGRQTSEMLTNILQKNNLKLISLNIGGNQLGDRNFSEICVGISKNYYLLKLFAHDNDLAKISSTIIGTILRYDKKLIVIDLSKNNFNDETIVFLLKGLISNSSLESLYLNENNLTNNCLRTFETTLSINTSLKELFLEKNKFTPKACDMISEFLNKNKYLEYLSLVGNKLRNDNIDLILDKQKKIGAKVITKTDFYQTKLSYKEKINFYEYIY